MKYKYGFVKEIKSRTGNDIWYRFEIVEIMKKYGMNPEIICRSSKMRWYPQEIFMLLEK